MSQRRDQIDNAIAALQLQRALLGDAVVDVAVRALRAERAELAVSDTVQHLRLVSVLFLDVVGSTALGLTLDPEEIQVVMDGALQHFTQRVDHHGGQVLQYAGDSLLAAFGAEEVREDDAERAVLCGLALLEQAQSLAEDVFRHHGHTGFNVRVGVSSGHVLLGGGVDGDGTIRGSTVNMAARMEQSAPPGTLRISQDTWRLVRGLFDMDEQAPLQVKGADAPLQTWLVRGVAVTSSAVARRGVQGLRASLLGRDVELQALQKAWLELAQSTQLHTVLVLGDAGLGKSRLLDEFDAWLRQRPPVPRGLAARARERRRGRPYGLLRELLTGALGLADSEAAPVQMAQWVAAAAPYLALPSDAEVLGHLLGLDLGDAPLAAAGPTGGDARALRDRAFHHALQLLLTQAAAAGLCIALDDLHWADEGSLDFVRQLQGHPQGGPVLLLLAARPSMSERAPALAEMAAARTVLQLQPLSTAVCQELALALLKPLEQVPPLLVQVLSQAAEGNPFFMEELVNMLIDQGAIEVQDGRWQLVADRLSVVNLPPSLQGVLQARLDALPADRRRALQMAAVAGPLFWDRVLAVLDATAVNALLELCQREFVRAHEVSRLADATEYEFLHLSLHRVAYDSVLKRVKRAAHATLARWLQDQPEQDALHDQIAEHLERAEEKALACVAWQRAADVARRRFANKDALAHAARALALVGEDDLGRQLELHRLRMLALENLSDLDELARATDTLLALAERSQDAGWLSEAALRQSRLAFLRGDASAALAFSHRVLALAPATHLERRAQAHSQAMFAHGRLGHVELAREEAVTVLALSRESGARQTEAATLNQLGSMASDAGDITEAERFYSQALTLHRADGHLANEGGTLANLGMLALACGDLVQASLQLEQARALCDRVGQRNNVAVIDINLALALLLLGKHADSLNRASAAAASLAAMGDRWGEGAARRVQGQALLALGQADEGRAHVIASRDLFDELQLPHLGQEAVAVLVQEALERGDFPAARLATEDLLRRQAQGATLEGTDEPLRVLLATWQGLQAAGDERAPAALERAWSELEARAQRLPEGVVRNRFLHGLPVHRQIVQATGRGAPAAPRP